MENKNNLPNRWLARGLCLTAASVLALLAACGGGDIYSEPVPVPSSTPTNTPAPTNTPTPLPYAVIYSFAADGSEGAMPFLGLMFDGSGNFYGTAAQGGASNKGTAYKITPAGAFTLLHSFGTGSDGALPRSGLVSDNAGNFYGTTFNGGGAYDSGTVYKMTSSGLVTVLQSFGGGNGLYPTAALAHDGGGNFYGTTAGGGNNGLGTVYKITSSGDFNLVYSFEIGRDGNYPYAGLVHDGAGNFYGTTSSGGTANKGTVYKVTSAGIYTQLHSFVGGSDGDYPYAGLVADGAGNFYGTTANGGANNQGTVYKMTSAGVVSVIHSFAAASDGANPYAALVLDSAGNLYGTSSTGAANNSGSVFKLTSTRVFSVLHSFGAAGDGANPSEAALVPDEAGNLYGVTFNGGANGAGTVFRIPMQ